METAPEFNSSNDLNYNVLSILIRNCKVLYMLGCVEQVLLFKEAVLFPLKRKGFVA